jgi:hypothetical protein
MRRMNSWSASIRRYSKSQSVFLSLHSKKKVREIPLPSRNVTTKLSLGGNIDVITELFQPRGSLVSDIPAGDGKLVNLFYGVVFLFENVFFSS